MSASQAGEHVVCQPAGAPSIRVPPLERPLGLTESICAEFFDRVPCGLQVVAAATLAGRPELSVLNEAANSVAGCHPVLRSVLVRDRARGWRFRAGTESQVDVRMAPPGSAWRERFRAALDEPLDTEHRLWRVELVDHPTDAPEPGALIVVGHHAAVDGISAATLLQELVRAAFGHDLPVEDQSPIVPMEDLLPVTDGSLPVPGQVQVDEAWRVGTVAPVEQRRLRCTMRSLPSGMVEALRSRSHAAATTVTGTLMAVLVGARRSLSGATGTVGFNLPADVRPRVSPQLARRLVGAYFARSHVIAHAEELGGDPWSRARALERAFQEDLTRCLTRRPWTPADAATLIEQVSRPDRSTFDLAYLLTNIGVVEAGSVMTGMWFTTVQTAGVEAFVVSTATVGSTLHLTVAWPEPLVDQSEGECLADVLVEGLASIVS